jgi:hypothetical protein
MRPQEMTKHMKEETPEKSTSQNLYKLAFILTEQ